MGKEERGKNLFDEEHGTLVVLVLRALINQDDLLLKMPVEFEGHLKLRGDLEKANE